jgi:hypothetical protein
MIMNNSPQVEHSERLFVRSCLERSLHPGDSHHWLRFQALHSGSFAYSQLYQLKNKLLHEALESPVEVLPPKKICGLANQAANQAWTARFPVQVFPCLFEDLMQDAREQLLREQQGQDQSPWLLTDEMSA